MTIEQHDSQLALAAAMPCENARHLISAGLASALSYLEAGDALRIALCAEPDASTHEQVAIRAEASRKNRKGSKYGQSAVLGLRFANPALHFAAVDELSLDRKFSYSWRLAEPTGKHEHRPVGFRSEDRATTAARFGLKDQATCVSEAQGASASTWQTIDDCIAGLIAAGTASEIRFTWSAIKTPTEALQASIADHWLQQDLGLKLEVSVHSEGPLPNNLLRAIGRLALETHAVEITSIECDRNEGYPYSADNLTLLRHPDAKPPAILPSPEFLISAGVRRCFPDAPAGLPSDGTLVGTAKLHGHERGVMIPDRERSRHAYFVGSTGTGKSTMLLEMIRGDIKKGAGLLLIDPHGDLYEAVKAEFPWDRRGDLVLLDASNREHPFPLNVLKVDGLDGAQASTFITNELLGIFSSLYDMKAVSGPMFELYFSNTLNLIMNSDIENPKLSDVARVFEDARFRRDCLTACNDEGTLRFWRQTASRTSGEASLENIAPYIFSKVNRFVGDATLKPILASDEPGINFREAMDQNKVVLVNLAKGQIGAQSARFLGMAIMMRLLAATLGRGDVPEENREPFFVHVDEFQSLATESAATFLAEARKFNVSLTLASQTLSQLSIGGMSLADTVVANCGSMIMTRLGPEDADRLFRTYGPVISPSEMQSLPCFHAVGRFLARDIPPPPFVFNVPKPRRLSVEQKPTIDADNDDSSDEAEVIANKENYKSGVQRTASGKKPLKDAA